MGAVTDKLYYLQNTKELIRTAINEKGGSLDENTLFREYVTAINDLELATPNFPPFTQIPSKIKADSIGILEAVSISLNYSMGELNPAWTKDYGLYTAINLSAEFGVGFLISYNDNLQYIFFFESDGYGGIVAGNPIVCSTTDNPFWVFPMSPTQVILLQNIVSGSNLITYRTVISKGSGGLDDITIGTPTQIATVSSVNYNRDMTEIIFLDKMNLVVLLYSYDDKTIFKFYQISTNSVINTKTIDSMVRGIEVLNLESCIVLDENNVYLLDISNTVDEYEDVFNCNYLELPIIISENKIAIGYQNENFDTGYLRILEIINGAFVSYSPLELIGYNISNAFVSSNNNIIMIYKDLNSSISYQRPFLIKNNNTIEANGFPSLLDSRLYHVKTFSVLTGKKIIFIDGLDGSNPSYCIYDLLDEGLFLAGILDFDNRSFLEATNFLNNIICFSMDKIDASGGGAAIAMVYLSEIGVRSYRPGRDLYYGTALEDGVFDDTITIRTSPYETEISSKAINSGM